MSCGWDEFYAPRPSERVPNAPRGKALLPGDAIRLGVNIAGYVAFWKGVQVVP